MMKKYLLTAVFFVVSVVLGIAANPLPDKTYNPGCQLPLDLKTATVMDIDKDGHYETMQMIWCDLVNGIEFPLTSPIIYPIEGSKGTPINDVAEEPFPWKKNRRKPKVMEFSLEFYISVLNPTVIYDYQMRENDPNIYYTQYVPYTDVKDESGNGVTVTPNPASTQVGLNFNLAADNQVIIKLYSQNGQLIATIDNSFRSAGVNSISFDVSNLANGAYYIQTMFGTQTIVNTMYVLK